MAKYRVKQDRIVRGETWVKAGETVYSQKYHDYGLASDDTRMTGIEHVSVTLNADGDYPGFTIPVKDLEAL